MINKIIDNVVRYIESRIELVKLEVEDSLAQAMVGLIRGAVLAVFWFAVVFFVSCGLALLLNVWLGSAWAGYFIVAFVYALPATYFLLPAGKAKLREAVEKLVQQAFEKRKKNKLTVGGEPEL